MKTHFTRTGFFILILFPAFLGLGILTTGCYTAEFFPAPDYPNLRRRNVGKVEIVRIRPDRPYVRLGKLIFRDFSGNINDPSFMSIVRREAARRGAQGAWIYRRRIRVQDRFNTEHFSHRPTRPGRPERARGQRLQGRIGIVEVILFNYLD